MNIDLTKFQEGIDNFNKKNYALSIQNMDDYIATPCLIYGDYANLIKGFANYWLKNYEEAIRLISNSLFDIQIEKDFQAYYYRGLAYSKLNKFAEAEADLKKSIELNQFFASSRIWLYFLYKTFGEGEKAKQTVTELINGHPDNIKALINQSQMLYEDNYLDLFLSVSNDLNHLKPNDPNIIQNRALCNLALDNKMEALQDMNTVIKILSEKATGQTMAPAYYYRGIILFHLDLKEQAKVDLQTAKDFGIQESDEYLKKL